MITAKQLRILESLGTQGLRELKKIGGSYALFIPKPWVDFNTLEILDEDGNPTYWVKVMVEDDNTITFSPLDIEDLEDELQYVEEKKSK